MRGWASSAAACSDCSISCCWRWRLSASLERPWTSNATSEIDRNRLAPTDNTSHDHRPTIHRRVLSPRDVLTTRRVLLLAGLTLLVQSRWSRWLGHGIGTGGMCLGVGRGTAGDRRMRPVTWTSVCSPAW